MAVPKISVLLVDLDGTLIDTLPYLYALYCDLLRPFGIEGTEREFQALNGCTLKEIVARLKERYRLPPSEDVLLLQYKRGVEEIYAKANLFPFALETLEKIKDAGYNLFLVTSASRPLATLFVEKHQLNGLFTDLVTSEGLPGKPAPAIYLKALDIAGVQPNEAMAVEDSGNGLQAALSAGIFTLCLSPSLQTVEWNERYVCVPSWREIAHIFDSYGR